DHRGVAHGALQVRLGTNCRRERRVGKKHRVHVLPVDLLHHFRLVSPDRDLRAAPREQVCQRRPPRAGSDDRQPRHATAPLGFRLRVANRFSVPLASRTMLARCENTINAASTIPAQRTDQSCGANSRAKIANARLAASELTETYPEIHSTRPHTRADERIASGASARNTPPAVATPFPPLNLTNGENTWPSTVAMPTPTGSQWGACAPCPSSSTGTAPLAISMSPTGIAYFQPRTRNTLVAPRFLLP